MLALSELHAFHVEWLACRSSLAGREQRELVCWLLKQKPELVQTYHGQPALLRMQCLEIQRGSLPFVPKGLGEAAAKRYLGELLAKYKTLPEVSRGTFLEFVNRTFAEHSTEAALKRYLRVDPDLVG